MSKRIITIFLSLIMCFSTVFIVSGCTKGSFTVTFVLEEDVYLLDGELVQTVNSAQEIMPPIFYKPGYKQTGWSSAIPKITSDKTVYAQWQALGFSITFDGNGGVDSQGRASITYGADEQDKIAPDFTRKGYHFIGWDPVVEDVSDGDTIYAQWQSKEYVISFADADGTVLDIPSMTVKFDDNLGNLPTIESKDENYRFSHWATETGEHINSGIRWTIDKNTTLKAVYTELESYIITYELNGADSTNLTYAYNINTDTTKSILTDPTRFGYNFVGWTLNGGTEKFTSEQLTVGMFYIDDQPADAKVTAHWQPKECHVSFSAYPGTLPDASVVINVVFGEAIGELPTPTYENHKFDGWRYNGKLIKEGDIWEYETDATLFAEYKAIYKVRFSLDTTIYGESISTKLINWGNVPGKDDGIDFEDLEFEIIEGETLYGRYGIDNFPLVDPYEYNGVADGKSGEFFYNGYWKYVHPKVNEGERTKSTKIFADTVFNSVNFPRVGEDGVIILEPHCRAEWSPSV